jgi:ABC-type transport system involved in multi-copper enzyme maturation permease subunit
VRPIIRRELIELLRTRKALALQVSLALACSLLVLLRWPTGEVGDLSGARAQEVLRIFGYGALAGVLLMTPAMPATAIVREKVQGTLALLLNSPLSGWSIYLGKLGGALGFTVVLLLMMLPAAAACHALGGTSVRGGVGLLFVILLLAAVQFATLGLLVSSRSQSPDGALRATYALVLAVSILPLVPYWLLQGSSGTTMALASWLRALSPIPAVMELLGHGGLGTHGMSVGGGAVARYALLAGGMSLACALATVARLNHTALDRARPAGVLTEDRPRGQRLARRLMFLVDPRRRSGAIGDWVNPVMIKEFRTRRFGRSHWTLRTIALCAILSLGLSYLACSGAVGWGVELIGGALVLLQVVLLILIAPSLAAGLISAERESGSWQLIRLTPLSPASILGGKLLSVVWPLLLILCATLPGYLIMAMVEPTLAGRAQRVLISLVLTGGFTVLASAAAGAVFRSTAAAATTSYLVLLAVCVGPLLVWLGREAPFGPRIVETALAMSPVAAALHAAHTPGFTDYNLIPANWWLIGSASLAFLGFLIVWTWHLYRPE